MRYRPKTIGILYSFTIQFVKTYTDEKTRTLARDWLPPPLLYSRSFVQLFVLYEFDCDEDNCMMRTTMMRTTVMKTTEMRTTGMKTTVTRTTVMIRTTMTRTLDDCDEDESWWGRSGMRMTVKRTTVICHVTCSEINLNICDIILLNFNYIQQHGILDKVVYVIVLYVSAWIIFVIS